MAKRIVVVSILGLFAVAGCSEKNSPNQTSNAPEQASIVANAPAPAVQKTPVVQDLPEGIKGLAFEIGGKCAIDIVNTPQSGEVVTVKRSEPAAIAGWAFDDKAKSVPAIIALQLAKGDSRYHALVERKGGRDDLTKAYGEAKYADAGYSAVLDFSSLPVGQYDVLLVQRAADKNLVCSTYRKLELVD